MHGRISPEQVVPLATQSSNSVIRGQDRVLVYIPVRPLAFATGQTIVAIHLDYPGTTLEILLPLAQDGRLPVVCPLTRIHHHPWLALAKVWHMPPKPGCRIRPSPSNGFTALV